MGIFDGTVLQNAENKSQSMCGGGVNIRGGGLYMYDGSVITNCKARHGGGVEVNSKSKAPAGAMFGMAGGSIENCEAKDGGGVYINIGMFRIEGGRITRNAATNNDDTGINGGGGVYVAGAGKQQLGVAFIVGGEISGNSTVQDGGGILEGSPYAQLYIQDEGTIKNNTAKMGDVLNGEITKNRIG